MGITAAFAVPHPPLIIPEIGKGEERGIQNTIDAYEEAARRIAGQKPETIVLLSPHQTMYADYFHISPGSSARGDFGRFGAGQIGMEVAYDTEFVEELCKRAADWGAYGMNGTNPGQKAGAGKGADGMDGTVEAEEENFCKRSPIPAGTLGERDRRLDHGTMVPLYFVNHYWRDYRLVRIGLSGLSLAMHYEFGRCIQETAEALQRNVVVIASGDLSHRLKEDGPYGYREEGPQYDKRVMDVLERADFGELLEFSEGFCESAGECGHRSFTIMAGALDQRAVEAEWLSYEGPFGVGYGICAYEVSGRDEARNFGEQYEEKVRRELAERRSREDIYVKLARRTVETFVNTGRKPERPAELPGELTKRRAGVFVSIHKDGRLRGCIGTIQAVQADIAEEIMENAVSASTRDPRFSPIEPEELERLEISVDVLGETEPITSLAELDVKRYGVIVTRGRRRGLLLPNLEGVDTVEEQISIARQKAGIPEDAEVELERFEVVRHF